MEQKNDPFKTDKPLYDYGIEYDYSHLPDSLKEIISELESFDKVGDWFSYDMKFPELDIDAKSYSEADNTKEILARHVMSPVRFSKSIENMILDGVDTFIEIGPGKVLSGFVKKISKEVKIYNIQDVESLKNTVESLKNS